MNESRITYPAFVKELGKKGSVFGLDSMRALLKEVGNPEEKCHVIHVAGTNGKGSTIAFLSSILMEAKKKVGRYISPTIQCYEERFQINQCYISQNRLQGYYDRIKKALKTIEEKGLPCPTLFEVETAIAFLYFSEENVDYVLLEVGMGGMSDATNVIFHPVISVITSISLDHKGFLGESLEEIAGQKAGIVKKRHPVVLAENKDEVFAVVEKKAREMESPLYRVSPQDYSVIEEAYYGSTFEYLKCKFEIHLPGRHQISNAVTALTVVDQLPDITLENMQAGLKNARWPGRLEIMQENPILIRDGAHNPDGARKLADYLEKHFTKRTIIYIMGVLRDKEYACMLDSLLPLGSRLFTFRPDNNRGLDAQVLANAAKSCSTIPIEICKNVNDALQNALAMANKEDIVVLCGSLSFMEEMKEYYAYRKDRI